MARRIIEIDQETCNGCGACAEACHEQAIGMVGGKARLLREDPRLPVKAAALDSGFGSLRTFYRLFLARYGVTPARYRDNL